jgi:hypothetical protein
LLIPSGRGPEHHQTSSLSLHTAERIPSFDQLVRCRGTRQGMTGCEAWASKLGKTRTSGIHPTETLRMALGNDRKGAKPEATDLEMSFG